MNELSRLLNIQTKELMEKIDSNQARLTENQNKLSARIKKIEDLNEQRSSELETRLNKLEETIKSFDSNESKINSMAELIDNKIKDIYDTNRRYEGMFRDVAKEMAIIKTSPAATNSHDFELLKAQVDQIDQNARNAFLVLTGLANEFQNINGVIQFFQNYLKVNISAGDIASVANIGPNRQGQTLTKITFYSVDTRVRVYKARASMKGTANQIWLNEDLTRRREWLDYLARLLFKGKHISNNWTFLGDIYVKKTAISEPRKITCQEDFGPLPPDLNITPRQTRTGTQGTQGIPVMNQTPPLMSVNTLQTSAPAYLSATPAPPQDARMWQGYTQSSIDAPHRDLGPGAYSYTNSTYYSPTVAVDSGVRN